MRKGNVFWNGELAGILTSTDSSNYVFEYADAWLDDASKPAISLTFPKTQKRFQADHLFPFFFNMISEGANRRLQSRLLHVDENDHFGMLLATSSKDGTGAVSVELVKEENE